MSIGLVRTLTDGCRTTREATKPFPTRTLPCKLNKENAMGNLSGLCMALLLGTVPHTWCSIDLVLPKTRAPTQRQGQSQVLAMSCRRYREQYWPKAENYRGRESLWPPTRGKGTDVAWPGCRKAREQCKGETRDTGG